MLVGDDTQVLPVAAHSRLTCLKAKLVHVLFCYQKLKTFLAPSQAKPAWLACKFATSWQTRVTAQDHSLNVCKLMCLVNIRAYRCINSRVVLFKCYIRLVVVLHRASLCLPLIQCIVFYFLPDSKVFFWPNRFCVEAIMLSLTRCRFGTAREFLHTSHQSGHVTQWQSCIGYISTE